MKKTFPLLTAIVLGAALTLPAIAQTTAAKPVKVVDAEAKIDVVKKSAVVTAIDMKNRIVTLKTEDGAEFAVNAGPKVKNLAQVKVGDNVTTEYVQAVALDFQKGDGIRSSTTFNDTASAKAGAKPGAAAVRSVSLVSNIWSINQAKGTVLVRGPYGHFAEVKLNDPALLNGVKVGDQMKVTYTQAEMITVTPAK